MKTLNHWGFPGVSPKMLEIGIISIIVLAVGYWVTLWLMGRHDDVLHGDFVHGEEGASASVSADQPLPAGAAFSPRPPFPPKPVITRRSAIPSSAAIKPRPAASVAAQASLPAQAPSPPTPALSERSDTLQTLLASIKRDLKDASQL
jgi:hypothetical protein